MSSSEVGVFPNSVDVATWFNPEYLNFQRPEIAKFIGGLTFDPEINNTIISDDRARHLLLEGGFEHGARLEMSMDGGIDPLELTRQVTKRLIEIENTLLPGLSEFKYRFATNSGATDGINEVMVGLLAENAITKVGIIKGDYKGYIGAASAKGIEIQNVGSLEEVGEPEDGVVWFVSNPSAINGNLHDSEVWEEFLDAGHKVVVDAAYIDLTLEGNSVDVSSPNIIAVITSPSKPFGLVLDKHPGFVYTREKHAGLHLQKKFNGVPRLLTIMEVRLQEEFGPHKIASLHRPAQLAICQDMSAVANGEVLPSDATLMAHATGILSQDFDSYRTVNFHERESDYTFRLTKELARRALLRSQEEQS